MVLLAKRPPARLPGGAFQAVSNRKFQDKAIEEAWEMKHRRIILAFILGILLVSVVLISAATGQGGIGGQAPTYKVAFELTQQTLQADRSKLPTAPKSSEVKLSTSCPDLSFKPGI